MSKTRFQKQKNEDRKRRRKEFRADARLVANVQGGNKYIRQMRLHSKEATSNNLAPANSPDWRN